MDQPTPTPTPAATEAPNALIPAGWCGLAVVSTCLGGALIGWMGSSSESAGERAAIRGSIPLGFLIAGALAAVGMHFGMKTATPTTRLAAPFGCGCVGSVVLFGLVFLFFAVIFPML